MCERIYRPSTSLNSNIGSNSTLLLDRGGYASPQCPPDKAASFDFAETEDPRPSVIRRCYNKLRGKFTRSSSRHRSIQDRPPTPFYIPESRAVHIPEEPDEEEPSRLGKKWWAVWEDPRAVPGKQLPRGPRPVSEGDLNDFERASGVLESDHNISHLRLPSPVMSAVVKSPEDSFK